MGAEGSDSLEFEAATRAQAAADSVSPGAFKVGDALVKRVYSDQLGTEGPAAEPSRFTQASLQHLEKSLESLAVSSSREDVFYGFYYDAEADKMVVEGNVSKADISKLGVASALIAYSPSSKGGRSSRQVDSSPFWGGARITSGSSGCSSGFIVKNSSGTRFAVTAAHCGNLNSTWKSGSHTYGKMTKRGSFPTYDMALIGGQSYAPYIYSGGTASSTCNAAGAPADPVAGTTDCANGVSTGENCGKRVTSLSGTFCDSSGCTNALAVYTGGTATAAGDSGGALLLLSGGKSYPRGIHIARSGTNMYAERWSNISSHLGVSGITP